MQRNLQKYGWIQLLRYDYFRLSWYYVIISQMITGRKTKIIIPAICYGIDRQAIIDAVLLGQGMPAYGPLQRNIYNNEKAEHYDYDPEKARRDP